MPREPKPGTFVIGKTYFDPVPTHMAWIRTDDTYAVPMRFSATLDLIEPEFIVTIDIVMDGTKPSVRRLEAIRGRRDERNFIVGGESGITTTGIRQILVDQMVRHVIEQMRQKVEQMPEEHRALLVRGGLMTPEVEDTAKKAFRVPDHGPETNAYIAENAFRIPGVTPPGSYQVSPAPARTERASTRENIALTAEYYKQAVANGSSAPQKDVALALRMSTSRVSRYLKSARDQGLLDEPKKPLSEMPPEDYKRMLEGMGSHVLDPTRDPSSE